MLTEKPIVAATAGALTIAWSAILVRLSHASPSTAAVFRCAYAVPVLAVLAVMERRRYGSAVFAAVAGAVIGDVSFVPSWPGHGWLLLLAISSQVVGWLLISISLPRLPAAHTSVLLTIQPVGSVLLGVAIFSESPSAAQLAGVAVVLAGVMVASLGPRRTPAPVYAREG
jgi:drug/metabolite transporter (DMT)-like permease